MEILKLGRTRLIGAAAGAAIVASLGLSSAFAQDTATPEPGSATAEATPATGSDKVPAPQFDGTAEMKTRFAEQAQHVADTIATVQKDRDSVTTSTDLTAVDDLLTKANKFAADAKTALNSDDISSVPAKLIAAEQTARAAEDLIRAQLSAYGLPSQQAGASRTLVAAYNSIDELTKQVGDSDSEDAKALLASAQQLYSSAYDLYGAGTYAQAAATARVAAQLGEVSAALSGGLMFSVDVESGQQLPVPGKNEGNYPDQNAVPANRGDMKIEIRGGDANGIPGPGNEAFPGVDPGKQGAFIVNGPGFGFGVDAKSGGYEVGGDFSTESPLEVPAPVFD